MIREFCDRCNCEIVKEEPKKAGMFSELADALGNAFGLKKPEPIKYVIFTEDSYGVMAKVMLCKECASDIREFMENTEKPREMEENNDD